MHIDLPNLSPPAPPSPLSDKSASIYAARDLRSNHPGFLVLVKAGDSWEAFDEDAVIVSRTLRIALQKWREIPMAVIPDHCAGTWIEKLVAAGKKVVTTNGAALQFFPALPARAL